MFTGLLPASLVILGGFLAHISEADFVRLTVSRVKANGAMPGVVELLRILKAVGYRKLTPDQVAELDGAAVEAVCKAAEEAAKPARRSAVILDGTAAPVELPRARRKVKAEE